MLQGTQILKNLKSKTEILSIFKLFSSIEIANAIMKKVRPKQTFLDAAEQYEATVVIILFENYEYELEKYYDKFIAKFINIIKLVKIIFIIY